MKKARIICQWCDSEFVYEGEFRENDPEYGGDEGLYFFTAEPFVCPECEHTEFCWLEEVS